MSTAAARRRMSVKPGARRLSVKPDKDSANPPEFPWDTLDRCLLPVVFSHAAAVIVSTVLNTLYISQVSSFTLFVLFITLALGSTLFYHNLKVSTAGRCILVTGCDSRIGSSVVRYLDDLGFTVFAGFQVLGDGSKSLKDECSGRVHVLELDVTSEQSVHAALSHIVARLPDGQPGLWCIINAACWAAYGEVEWVPFSVYKRSLDINFFGTIRVIQVFLPLIRKAKGRIVNLVSIQGRIASAVRSPFCSAKFALEGFTECLRLEMRRWGVDVVVVEPGIVSTGSWFDNKEMLEEAKIMWQSMSPQQRQDYGEDYFEYRIRSMKEYQAEEGDLSVLLRSVGDAVHRTFPLTRYTPVSRNEKLQALIAHHLPRSVYDIMYS